MATDILNDRILFALRKIIESDTPFKCFNLKPRGSECIVFVPSNPSQINITTDGTGYNYPVSIDFHSPVAVEDVNRISQEISDILRVLNDNCHYSTGGVYYWHNGMVDDVEYNWETEESESYKARILWSCTHEEVT
jgi:hypothetical protein